MLIEKLIFLIKNLKKLIFSIDKLFFIVYYGIVIKKINSKINKINKGREIMNKYDEVLAKIQNGELSSKEGLELLYPTPKVRLGKRAHFIKLKIHVADEGKGVNTFLRILFALPIPLVFARFGLRFAERFTKDEDVDFNEIRKMLKYSKNTRIDVDTDDAKVNIRIV